MQETEENLDVPGLDTKLIMHWSLAKGTDRDCFMLMMIVD
jgi:hypothetical protein